MVYAQRFVLVTIKGHFQTDSSAEIWTTHLKVSGSGIDTSFPLTNLAAFLTAISTDVQTYHQSAEVFAGSAARLTELNAALIDTDGKYVGGGTQITTVFTYPSGVAGGGTTFHPWTSACVLSLRTAQARGPASHGRMYWPATAMTITASTGRLASTVRDGVAGRAQTMLNAISAKAKTTITPSIFVANASKVGSGLTSAVIKVRVDDRLDNIERRENATAPLFSELPVTP